MHGPLAGAVDIVPEHETLAVVFMEAGGLEGGVGLYPVLGDLQIFKFVNVDVEIDGAFPVGLFELGTVPSLLVTQDNLGSRRALASVQIWIRVLHQNFMHLLKVAALLAILALRTEDAPALSEVLIVAIEHLYLYNYQLYWLALSHRSLCQFSHFTVISSPMELVFSLILIDPQQPKPIQTSTLVNDSLNYRLAHLFGCSLQQLKDSYISISALIEVESHARGPKNFAQLVQELGEIIKTQIYQLILAQQEELAILNLTYCSKYLQQWFIPCQSNYLQLLSAIASIHLFLRIRNEFSLNSAFDKVASMARIYPKCNKSEPQNHLLVLLLKGVTMHLKDDNKKAKYFLTKTLDQVSRLPAQTQRQVQIAVIVISSMLYLYKVNACLNVPSLSHYYFTKCYEACVSLPNGIGREMAMMIKANSFPVECEVKLTRIENKLQNNRRPSVGQNTQFRVSKTLTKIIPQNPIIAEELKNIFLIKDTKSTNYRLRKENLRYLAKEQKKMSQAILEKRTRLVQVIQLQNRLESDFEIAKIKNQIVRLNNEKETMQQDFRALKQENFSKLKQFKSVETYLQGMLAHRSYEKLKVIHNFLYGKMLSRSKIFILGFFFRKKIKKIKSSLVYKKEYYRGVLHFVEVYRILNRSLDVDILLKNKEPGYYLKVYPIEKARSNFHGIICDRKIDEQTANVLKIEPFYLHFELKGNELITWSDFINQKKFLTIYYLKTFMKKFYRHHVLKTHYTHKQKLSLKLYFGSKIQPPTIINAVLVLVKKISKTNNNLSLPADQYEASVFTIGGPHYANPRYQIVVNLKYSIDGPNLNNSKLNNVLYDSYMAKMSQELPKISLIQKNLKMLWCRQMLVKIKMKSFAIVKIHGNVIYTFKKSSNGATTLTVQNYKSGDRETMDTFFDSSAFNLIDVLREKLSTITSCKEKIKLICKYARGKIFIAKLRSQFKGVNKLTEFQKCFRDRIVFAKSFKNYIYNEKRVEGKILIMLIVQSLIDIPRPYALRIFTLESSEEGKEVEVKKKIFHKEKKYYETNINKLNQLINITSKNQFQIFTEQPNNFFKPRTSKSKFPVSPFHPKAAGSNSSMADDPISQHIIKIHSHKSKVISNYRNRSSLRIRSSFGVRKHTSIHGKILEMAHSSVGSSQLIGQDQLSSHNDP